MFTKYVTKVELVVDEPQMNQNMLHCYEWCISGVRAIFLFFCSLILNVTIEFSH